MVAARPCTGECVVRGRDERAPLAFESRFEIDGCARRQFFRVDFRHDAVDRMMQITFCHCGHARFERFDCDRPGGRARKAQRVRDVLAGAFAVDDNAQAQRLRRRAEFVNQLFKRR